MTTERDPAVDKAWRAHSREEPPPALDQAILAAAHRAVASGPREIAPEATRPPRWWMPLAAAATIGAIAIGVLQLAPPETALDTSSTAPSPAQRYAEEKPASVAAPSADRGVAQAPADPRPAAPLPQPRPEEKAAMPAPAKKQKDAADDTKLRQAPAQETPAKPAKDKGVSMMVPESMDPHARANRPDAQGPEPFPGEAGGRKAETADKRAMEGSRNSSGFAADAVTPGAPPAAAPATPPQRADAKQEMPSERLAAAAPAPAASPPPPTAPAPAAKRSGLDSEKDADSAAGRVGRTREAPRTQAESQGAASGTVSQLAKNVEPTEEARQKARDPDAWIARIRKLRDEGRTADAQRELREFRALVPDAERRLPADLRDWKP